MVKVFSGSHFGADSLEGSGLGHWLTEPWHWEGGDRERLIGRGEETG